MILTSVESEADALRLAKGVVEKGLAACVQISAPGRSIYQWQGKLQSENEHYLSIKTTEEASTSVVVWLEQNHPYETPEILGLNAASSRGYLEWMRATTS